VPVGVHNTRRYAALITPQNAIRSEQFHVATLKGSRSAPEMVRRPIDPERVGAVTLKYSRFTII